MDGGSTSREIVQRWLFPFCGIGGGALGFSRAKASLDRHGITGRVEVVGGIDIDPAACRDFERIVGAPALCTDVRALTPWECLVLQSFDAYDAEGRAWVLDGENVTAWRKAIGNAVPPLAAKEIAVQLLLTQMHAEVGLFTLSSAAVWVSARKLPEWIRALGAEPLYVRPSPRAARLCGTFAPLEAGDPWALAVRTPTTMEVGHG